MGGLIPGTVSWLRDHQQREVCRIFELYCCRTCRVSIIEQPREALSYVDVSKRFYLLENEVAPRLYLRDRRCHAW